MTIRGGRGNKARTIPLNASARSYLAPRLNCDPPVKAVAFTRPHHTTGRPSLFLWQSQKKGRLTTSAMRQMIDVLV
ncbi:hypothetical protein [Ktedonobacter sp. SOSP1-85]|uniref:hypothetical protein n=1 Tax=Ktedonobacter sp. SOSP1-85 TaxID=2778367 RepID=UPI001915634C|nr:hypothetical protein [Ktedonobacter sp. SOSP1-85]